MNEKHKELSVSSWMDDPIKLDKMTLYPNPYLCPDCKNGSWMIKSIVALTLQHLLIECTECGHIRQIVTTDDGTYLPESFFKSWVLDKLRSKKE